MNCFIIKREEISFLDTGWGNGYISLPSFHPLYKKNYQQINESNYQLPHGNWTCANYFKDFNSKFKIQVLKNSNINDLDWILGFDTAHLGDNKKKWSKKNVLNETLRIFDFYSNIENFI